MPRDRDSAPRRKRGRVPRALALAATAVLGAGSLAPFATPAAAEADEVFRIAAEVLALRDVRVPAEVAGRVVERPDDETAAVKAGEVVVTLDDVFLSALARGARAAVERAEARVEWTRLELKREKELFERGSVGQANLDKAELTLREAAANLVAAEAAAEEAEARWKRAKIRAPFDGRLVRVKPERGEYLRVGETAFRIVDDSALRVVAYVPAQRVAEIKVGQTVRVRADFERADRPPLEAKVFSVAPAAEGRARTFRVETRLKDGARRLRPGMAAELAFTPGGGD